MAISPCRVSAVDGKSAGTAVGSRTHAGSRNSLAEGCTDHAIEHRFTLKHFGAVCKGGVHFGSCYLHANLGQNRSANLDTLQRLERCSALYVAPG